MAGRKQAPMTNAAAMALLVVALLAIVAVAPAATTGPYTPTVCGVNLVNMKGACEKYCARGSTEAWPGKPCCDALEGANLDCLCALKRKIGSIGNIDARRAMQVPSKCGMSGVPPSC